MGGILLAFGGSIPIGPYATTISFTIHDLPCFRTWSTIKHAPPLVR